MYELATLKRPFSNNGSIIRANYDQELLCKRAEPIPKVIPIIEKMLKMNPDGRPSAEKILSGNIN